LVRDVIYAEIEPAERMRLHRAAAAAIELAGATPPRHSERTHHLLAAGPAAYEEAVSAAVLAARHAASYHAHEDAVVLLERTRRAVEGPERDHLACDLLLALGATHQRAGHFEEGKQACLSAAEIARRLEDAPRLARAALGYGGE